METALGIGARQLPDREHDVEIERVGSVALDANISGPLAQLLQLRGQRKGDLGLMSADEEQNRELEPVQQRDALRLHVLEIDQQIIVGRASDPSRPVRRLIPARPAMTTERQPRPQTRTLVMPRRPRFTSPWAV